jgi:putative heme-binding domain-containing protein
MQLIGGALALAIALVAGGGQIRNPRDGDPAAIQAGAALFRERCADCHGADAKGVRGPDLTQLWTAEGSDERAFRTIRSGVPGSIMPSSPAPDDEVWAIVAYLRNISTARPEESSGNVANGERIFTASCASCHRVKDRGGRLGPDLSRIAASQSNQVLARAIRDASASFTSGYDPVTLVTRDGQQIQGTRKGEDAFSIQIMDTRERLQGYLKANLREVIRDKKSLMPDFASDRLSDRDLNDLLAFFGTLRTSGPSGRPPASSDDPR